jgi:hypothetical protein
MSTADCLLGGAVEGYGWLPILRQLAPLGGAGAWPILIPMASLIRAHMRSCRSYGLGSL